MGTRALGLGRWALLLLACAMACGPSGAATGAPCMLSSDCASRLCLRRGSARTCAARCASTAECSGGDVCGGFDFRGIDDAGNHSGPVEDVVRLCRPRLNAVCTSSVPCAAPGAVCVGAPGVCTTNCSVDNDCASRLCLPPMGSACALGTCAPLCDDPIECPSQWYCDQTSAAAVGNGRCLPIQPMPSTDAGACMSGIDH